MMRFTLLLMVGFLMNACSSDEQKSSEKYIKATLETSWAYGIPLDDLFKVSNICREHPDYLGCSVVYEQLTDISLSLQSCLASQRSRLCRSIVLVVSKHPISKLLPNVEPVVLPSNPFFWSMPTFALEALSYKFNYRLESMTWWWAKWNLAFLLIVTFLLLVSGLYVYWIYRKKIQLEIFLENEAKVAQQLEVEKELARQVQQAKRAEALEREAKKETEMAKQKLVEEKNIIALKAKLANEKQAKLANEKAEAEALLQAVFKRKD